MLKISGYNWSFKIFISCQYLKIYTALFFKKHANIKIVGIPDIFIKMKNLAAHFYILEQKIQITFLVFTAI